MTKPVIVHQPDLFSTPDDQYRIIPISPKETVPFIMDIHYAHRMPPISYSFGLTRNDELLGIVTYGKPASRTLCTGVCGDEWSEKVIELNRLCLLNNRQNEASRLVGGSLRLLPKPTIVVSYADTGQDHLGVIYQATNFLYTGTTVPRDDWYIEGEETSHIRRLGHLASEHGGLEGLRQEYGDRLRTRPRSVKHRYVYLVGSRSDRRALRAALRYEQMPYPKRQNNETQSTPT